MKKLLIIISAAMMFVSILLMTCTDDVLMGDKMENRSVKEWGTKQIGNNLYLKLIYVNESDKLYFLVDSTNKLVCDCSNTTIQMGKSRVTETISSQ